MINDGNQTLHVDQIAAQDAEQSAKQHANLRILFIALSRLSSGELNNAISVARRLREHGASILFLMPEGLQWYVKAAEMPVITLLPKLHQRDIVTETVSSFRPDAILLADAYLLDLESELIDLNTVLETGLPCATLDALAFSPEARVIGNSLIRKEDERMFHGKYNHTTQLRDLPPSIHVFRPCPVHAPALRNERISPVKLYDESFTIDPQRRREVRAKLGVKDDNERLILLAKASWGMIGIRYRLIKAAGRSTALPYRYDDFLQDLMLHYLADVDRPVTIVSITTQEKDERESVHTGRNDRRFVKLPSMDNAAFSDLQRSSDLYLTDNVPSSAMAKAVFAHVPSVALINTSLTGTQDGSPIELPSSLGLTDEQAALIQKWNTLLPGGIYPFYLYPNGWIHELEPLLHDNPYYEALVKVEMYEVAQATKIFTRLLCDEQAVAEVQAQQQRYIGQVLALPSAYDEIADWILQSKTGKKEVYA